MHTGELKLIINNLNILVCWLIFLCIRILQVLCNINAQEAKTICSCIYKLISVSLCAIVGIIFASVRVTFGIWIMLSFSTAF